MLPAKKRLVLFLGVVLLIGIGVRLAGVASRPIFYDEAFSLLISQKGPSGVLEATLGTGTGSASPDIHPPAYYFTLWGWIQLFGPSVASGRALSILFSAALLVTVFFLSKELFGERVALIASLATGLLPFQVQYGVDIRMYILLTFFLILSTFAYFKANTTNQTKWWVLFAACAALAQYTQNLAVFYLVPLALTGVFQRKWKVVRNTLLASLGAVLIYLPWLIHIPAQFARIQEYYWVQRPSMAAIFNLALTYVSNLPLPKPWVMPMLFISLLLIALAAFQTYLAVKRKTSQYKIGLWLAYLSFSMPILLWIFSQWRPIYIERILLPANVMFCIWIVWALLKTQMPKPVQILYSSSLVLAIAAGLFEYYAYTGFPYGQYAAIDASIAERLQPGDIIVHSNKLTYLPAVYFDDALPQVFILDRPGSGEDTLAPETRDVLGLHGVNDIESSLNGAQRIWFVIFQEAIDEYAAAGRTIHPHIEFLNEHLKLISSETWDGILVMQYQKTNP